MDLYAGTGAVGIEAISRGAGQVWFAESGEAALRALRANLAALKIGSGFAVEERGTGALLERLAKTGTAVDVVFLDPPYEAEEAYAETLNFLGGVRGKAMLADDAVVIAEHSSKATIAERFGMLERYRQMQQGEAAVSFFRALRGVEG